MRITHNMMTRNYMNSLNKNMKNLSGSNAKLSSQRSFNRAHENIANADRTLRTRALLEDNERNLNAIDTVGGRYSAAENGLSAANTVINKVTDLVMKATNGTFSEADREIISSEIDKLQEQVFQIMNGKFGDKYIYGASGNHDGSAPFSTDVNGFLQYQGSPVNAMQPGPNGKILDGLGNEIPFNDPSYIDIGLGFSVDETTREVDPRTAIKSTFSGVEMFGYGQDLASGLPNNLYSLLGVMSDSIKAGDLNDMNKGYAHLQKVQENLMISMSGIGNMTNYMEQTQTRLEAERLTLQTVQQGLESVDLSQEIMYNKDFEMSWMVTLQLGSKVLPPSIFDFMR